MANIKLYENPYGYASLDTLEYAKPASEIFNSNEAQFYYGLPLYYEHNYQQKFQFKYPSSKTTASTTTTSSSIPTRSASHAPEVWHTWNAWLISQKSRPADIGITAEYRIDQDNNETRSFVRIPICDNSGNTIIPAPSIFLRNYLRRTSDTSLTEYRVDNILPSEMNDDEFYRMLATRRIDFRSAVIPWGFFSGSQQFIKFFESLREFTRKDAPPPKTNMVGCVDTPETQKYRKLYMRSRVELRKIASGPHPLYFGPSSHQTAVIARRNLESGEVIGEYTGEIVSVSSTGGLPATCSYQMELEKDDLRAIHSDKDPTHSLAIDGCRYRNECSMINDVHGYREDLYDRQSKPLVSPNCSTVVMFVNGMPRIFCYARKAISAGKELLLNYGFGYWSEHMLIADIAAYETIKKIQHIHHVPTVQLLEEVTSSSNTFLRQSIKCDPDVLTKVLRAACRHMFSPFIGGALLKTIETTNSIAIDSRVISNLQSLSQHAVILSDRWSYVDERILDQKIIHDNVSDIIAAKASLGSSLERIFDETHAKLRILDADWCKQTVISETPYRIPKIGIDNSKRSLVELYDDIELFYYREVMFLWIPAVVSLINNIVLPAVDGAIIQFADTIRTFESQHNSDWIEARIKFSTAYASKTTGYLIGGVSTLDWNRTRETLLTPLRNHVNMCVVTLGKYRELLGNNNLVCERHICRPIEQRRQDDKLREENYRKRREYESNKKQQ